MQGVSQPCEDRSWYLFVPVIPQEKVEFLLEFCFFLQVVVCEREVQGGTPVQRVSFDLPCLLDGHDTFSESVETIEGPTEPEMRSSLFCILPFREIREKS